MIKPAAVLARETDRSPPVGHILDIYISIHAHAPLMISEKLVTPLVNYGAHIKFKIKFSHYLNNLIIIIPNDIIRKVT